MDVAYFACFLQEGACSTSETMPTKKPRGLWQHLDWIVQQVKKRKTTYDGFLKNSWQIANNDYFTKRPAQVNEKYLVETSYSILLYSILL